MIIALLTLTGTANGSDIFLPLVSPGDTLKWEPQDDYTLHVPNGLPANQKAKLEIYSPELNTNDYPTDRRSNSYVGDERYDRKGFSSRFVLSDPNGAVIRSQEFGLGNTHSWTTLIDQVLAPGDYPVVATSSGKGKNGFGLEVGPGLSLEASTFTLNARGKPGETIEVAKFRIPRSLVGKSIRIFNYDADGPNELGLFVTLPSNQRKALGTSDNLAWATNEFTITPELIGDWKVGVKIGPKPKQFSNAVTFKLRTWPSDDNLPVRLRDGDPLYAKISNPTPPPETAPKPVRYNAIDESGKTVDAKAEITGDIERQIKLEVPTGYTAVWATALEGTGKVISATQVNFGRDGGLAQFVLRRLPPVPPGRITIETVAIIGTKRVPINNVIVSVLNAPAQAFGRLGKSSASFEVPPGEWTIEGETLVDSSHEAIRVTLKSGETKTVTLEYIVRANLRLEPAQTHVKPGNRIGFTAIATTQFPLPLPAQLSIQLPEDLTPVDAREKTITGELSPSSPLRLNIEAISTTPSGGTNINTSVKANLEPYGLRAAATVTIDQNGVNPNPLGPEKNPPEPPVPNEADLEISKTVDQPTANVSVPLTYTVNVRNNGPRAAEDVRVLERLPATVRFNSASGDCVAVQPTPLEPIQLECKLGSLQPGENGLILIVVTPLEPGSIGSRSEVTSITADPNFSNNSASLVTEVAAAPAKLSLSRSAIQPSPALPGEIVQVRLKVQNEGGSATDFSLTDEPGELLQALEPTEFSGRIEAGTSREFSYPARVLPGTPATSSLRAKLQHDGPELEASTGFERLNLGLEKRFNGTVIPRPGQAVNFQITIKNPLARTISVLLSGEAPGMSLTPEENLTLELNALETKTLEVIGRTDLPGAYTNSVRLSIDGLPVAPDAAASTSVIALPERVRRSEVKLRVWAKDLPATSQLIIVDHIPQTATYQPGTSQIRFDDGSEIRLPDPLISDNKLFWQLEKLTTAQLAKGFTIQYTLAHEGPLEMPSNRLGVILKIPGRTDIVRVLEGEQTLGNAFQNARAPNLKAASRERIGALIVSPSNGQNLRDREQISVLVDLPLHAKDVRLSVNGLNVPESNIGTRTFDEGTGRLTLEYVAVKLQPGRNQLVLTATDPDKTSPDKTSPDNLALTDQTVQDQSEIFVSGSIAKLEISAQALTYDPQDKPMIRIRVSDANGLTPADGLVTVLVSPEPSISDADPNQPGFQIAFKDGIAEVPLSNIGVRSSVKVTANIGQIKTSAEFPVLASTRPPFAVGLISLEARFSSPFTVASSFSAFARSTVFGDSLLTVGIDAQARYDTKLTVTGSLQTSAQPYERFPLLGDASRRGSDVNSSDGFFIRLERGPSYVQYGGFNAGFEGRLSNYGSGFNGLSGLLRGNLEETSTYRLTSFAALVTQSNRTNITVQNPYGTPGDGTSLYRLEGAPIKPGSERVSVIVRDAKTQLIKISERQLERLSEYTIDTISGVILLQKALNRTDENGNLQYLSVEYASESSDLPLEIRAGAQGKLEFALANGNLDVRATALEYSTSKPLLFALGIGYSSDPKASSNFKLDLEAAMNLFGDNNGTIALNGEASYSAPNFNANARYQDVQIGFESPTKPDAGRAATLAANWKITPTLEFSASTAISQRFTAPINTSLEARADLRNDFGSFKLGLGALTRIGSNTNTDAFAVGSLFVPLEPISINIEQRVPISGGTSGQTVFTVAYAITQEFSLEFRDTWTYAGSSTSGGNNGTIGFKGRIGNTNLGASYELPNNNGQAGRARIGIDTNLPITPNLSAQIGSEYATPFNQTATLGLNLGINLAVDNTRASTRAQYNLSERGLKQVYSLGGILQPITGNTPLLISPSLEYTTGPDGEGTKFGIAAAYRGAQWTVLTNHQLRIGLYVPGASTAGDTSLEGELQNNYSSNEYFSVRGGAAYKWALEVLTYQINLGTNWFLTDSFGIGANAAYLAQPSTNTSKTSLGLEVNLKLITNLVASAGYNFVGFDGLGTVNTQQGFYVRLDWKFDERTFYGDPNPSTPSDCCPK
jgi:uncharacterized repeat protein (TIGR01451 family)